MTFLLELGFCDNKVLIDTWWNVNNITLSFTWIAVTVLIDTWWNVNPTAHAVRFISTEF